MSEFRIVSQPDFISIAPGARVSYYAVKDGERNDANLPGYSFKWKCVNDPATNGFFSTEVFSGPSTRHWIDAKWNRVGRHTIVLEVTKNGQKTVYEHKQWVDTASNILSREFDPRKNDKNPTPFQVLEIKERFYDTLKKIAVEKPPPADKREQHEKDVAEIEDYIGHLKFLLRGVHNKPGYAVDGWHMDAERSTRTSLMLWLVNMTEAGDDPEWRLIDWSNPAYRGASGVYDDDGDDHQEAVSDVVGEWDWGNRYPEGVIKYEFKVPDYGVDKSGEFETDGASLGDTVSSWLDWVALGGAVVAGVATLVAPVPGSRVVSAAIWTSILTGTAAATINIAQRHSEGHGNWKEDAFDGLSIVGNVFAGAGMAWKIGATVTSNAARLGPKMSKAVLIGQFSTDGVQGVLLGYDHLGKYNQIMDDPNLTPKERLDKLMELFRSAAIAGTLTYMSVKGTKTDMDNISGNKTLMAKPDLENPNTTIDLDAPTSSRPVGENATEVRTEVETNPRSSGVDNQTSHVVKEAVVDFADDVLTLKKQVHRDALDLKDKGLMSTAEGKAELRNKTAVSRVEIKGQPDTRTEAFYNLDSYLAKPGKANPLSLKGRGTDPVSDLKVVKDGTQFRINDKEDYITRLEKLYNDAGLEMHDGTKALMRDFFERNPGPYDLMAGLPGTHAEVLARNDLFHKQSGSVNPGDVDVATYKVTDKGPNTQWGEFPACTHCGGILQGNDIKTGRH